MSEMLGNQYFMARQFEKALHHFENVLATNSGHQKVQKKLIICYCEVGNVTAALNLFEKVIERNIELIVDTDLISEDCPCPELVKRMKWYEQVASTSFDYHCILGILNLYCHIEDSIASFETALQLSPQNSQILRLLKLIRTHEADHAAI